MAGCVLSVLGANSSEQFLCLRAHPLIMHVHLLYMRVQVVVMHVQLLYNRVQDVVMHVQLVIMRVQPVIMRVQFVIMQVQLIQVCVEPLDTTATANCLLRCARNCQLQTLYKLSAAPAPAAGIVAESPERRLPGVRLTGKVMAISIRSSRREDSQCMSPALLRPGLPRSAELSFSGLSRARHNPAPVPFLIKAVV